LENTSLDDLTFGRSSCFTMRGTPIMPGTMQVSQTPLVKSLSGTDTSLGVLPS